MTVIGKYITFYFRFSITIVNLLPDLAPTEVHNDVDINFSKVIA